MAIYMSRYRFWHRSANPGELNYRFFFVGRGLGGSGRLMGGFQVYESYLVFRMVNN